jgi:hypothetical protein
LNSYVVEAMHQNSGLVSLQNSWRTLSGGELAAALQSSSRTAGDAAAHKDAR